MNEHYVIETINRAGQIEHRISENNIPIFPFGLNYKNIYEAITKAHEISIREGNLEKVSTSFVK